MEVRASRFTDDVEHGLLRLLNFVFEVDALAVLDEHPLLMTHVRLTQQLIFLACFLETFVAWLAADHGLVELGCTISGRHQMDYRLVAVVTDLER